MATPNLFSIHLTADQRARLDDLTRNGLAPAKKILHARILLLADKDHPAGRYTDVAIAAALGLHVNGVARIRKLFVLRGEEPALDRKVRATPPTPAKIDGRVEAHLVATCCAPPPEGHAAWTLTLLVDELVKGRFVTSICRETVRRALKKTRSNRGGRRAGASRTRTARGS